MTKVFPTRSHTVAAQGGIAASLTNMGRTLAVAHVRHRQGLGLARRHRRHGIPDREAPKAVYELEHYGVPFSRTEEGKIYQRPFGGHMQNYGEGPPVQRTCAAADRTGHAILHTLYGQSLKNNAEFFIEYFAIDLIMEDEGRCPAWWPGTSMTAPSTASPPRWWCWRPAATAAPISRPPRPIPAPATAAAWSPAPACRCRTWSSCSSTRPGIYGAGCLITEGARGEGGYLDQLRGRALHGALCAVGQGSGLARRGLALHDHGDPRRPRRRQEQGPHPPAPGHLPPEVLARAAAGHLRKREDLRRRRRHPRADPGAADGALQHGRHADQLLGRGAQPDLRRSGPGRRRA
jgi:hypothetical protein